MIPWNAFAKRRNIEISQLSHETYEQYTAWCKSCRVEPVKEDIWLIKSNVAALTNWAETEITRAQTHPEENSPLVWVNPTFTEKQLKKKRKADLLDICEMHNVVVGSNDTKAVLIKLILNKQL